MSLADDIMLFLEGEGFHCRYEDCLPDESCTCIYVDETDKRIIAVEFHARCLELAARQSFAIDKLCNEFKHETGKRPYIITEDRWRNNPEGMKLRLLSHMNRHHQVFARNCEVRRIEKKEAAEFLSGTHSYGDANCRYRYGLFDKKNDNQLVAVATFSNARKWQKGEKTIRSYEWTRYASLPEIRVNGGMGKVLKAFIKDVKPDDIMSYADLEWSEGQSYEHLGFKLEGKKDAVLFQIDTSTWQRHAFGSYEECGNDCLFYLNFGSAKYRLKLTEYE